MKYRLNEFFARKDYTADATEVIDINIKDVISSIVIILEVANYTHVMAGHPVGCLPKIELLDGSDVLYSLDGFEAEALDWYNNKGKFRYNQNLCLTGNNFKRYIGINFGRYLWDKEYAFDPKKFTNPQLRLTLDLDAASNQTDHVYITCLANIFDEEAVTPVGFMMSKEIKEYTMADAVHEYTDLPLDFPYKGLYLRPFLNGTDVNDAVDNIKLSEDQDKKVPYDHGIDDILGALQQDLPFVDEYYIHGAYNTLRNLYVAPADMVTAVGSTWRQSVLDHRPAYFGGGGGQLQYIYNLTAGNVQLHVRGRCPHAVIEIPFGLKDIPGEWYDVRGLGSLRLDITGGAAATGFIFLQQVRSY